MSAARTIEQECDSLQAEALKGGEYVAITNGLALRLVGTIRTLAVSASLSERTREALRGAVYAMEAADWNGDSPELDHARAVLAEWESATEGSE